MELLIGCPVLPVMVDLFVLIGTSLKVASQKIYTYFFSLENVLAFGVELMGLIIYRLTMVNPTVKISYGLKCDST